MRKFKIRVLRSKSRLSNLMSNKFKYKIVDLLFGEDMGDLVYSVIKKDKKEIKELVDYFLK